MISKDVPKFGENLTIQINNKLSDRLLFQKIDNMLALDFFPYLDGYNIRKALKVMADKLICHYDAFDETDPARAAMIEKQLRDPYYEHNLKFIMTTVIECIGEGLSLKNS